MDQQRDPLFAAFARQMKRIRVKRGWSQEALGKKIGYSGEMVSKIETRRNDPSLEFATALDNLFPELEGVFCELVAQADKSWFATYADAERVADVIRMWNPLLFPGLVQTEGYIRAVYEAWRAVDGNPSVDASVTQRLERQSLLERPTPPSVGIVVAESILHAPIGGPKVMYEQLRHVAELSEHPRITVQVLPTAVGAHVGLLGAFVILSFVDDTPGMVYLESPDHGETSKLPARLGRLTVTYDALRDEALGARATRDLLRNVAEEKWKA